MEGLDRSNDVLVARLESARRELLDLSARNRLNNSPLASASMLQIVGERSSAVFTILATQGKAMRFLPAKSRPGSESAPDPKAFQDLYLQTDLEEDKLERRLLRLYQDARTALEEQGVDVLFLALGFLKWFEDDNSEKERLAPLLLVPVSLVRATIGAPFRLARRPADLETNLSLQEKLKSEFRIGLPDLPDEDELDPDSYFASVREAIATKKRWEVSSDTIALGTFTFSKFLMYRDLDPASWPSDKPMASNTLLEGLVKGRLGPNETGGGDEAPTDMDATFHPRELVHVLDADSSQALVIEEARRGRSLVIQGPPGTGKSQTIANLIVSAVKDAKRVLFVAEKMAALQVVKSRLEKVGLGGICLELHSHKANKKAVLDELNNTMIQRRTPREVPRGQADELARSRDRLNKYKAALHTKLQPSGKTPFEVMTQLISLREQALPTGAGHLDGALNWTASDLAARQRRWSSSPRRRSS